MHLTRNPNAEATTPNSYPESIQSSTRHPIRLAVVFRSGGHSTLSYNPLLGRALLWARPHLYLLVFLHHCTTAFRAPTQLTTPHASKQAGARMTSSPAIIHTTHHTRAGLVNTLRYPHPGPSRMRSPHRVPRPPDLQGAGDSARRVWMDAHNPHVFWIFYDRPAMIRDRCHSEPVTNANVCAQ